MSSVENVKQHSMFHYLMN